LPQLHHPGHTAFGGVGQLHLCHDGIFPIIHLTINHRVREILHIWVSRENVPLIFSIRNIWCFDLDFRELPLNMLDGFCKLVHQHCALDGTHSAFLPAILGAFGSQFTQHHLWMVYKIAVDGKAIFRFAKLHPVRLMVDRAVTFLEENNVADDFCSCVCFERSVRQTDSTQQISTFGNVLAGRRIFAVQRVATGDECHDAARTHLVDGLGEEIVVDAET